MRHDASQSDGVVGDDAVGVDADVYLLAGLGQGEVEGVGAGARPHAPGMATVSKVNSMSDVVFFSRRVPSFSRRASRIGSERFTWQAVPSHTRIHACPSGSSAKCA